MTDEVANLVVEQLKLLRGDVQATNARLDQTIARLDETNARLVDTTERLDMRLDHLAEGQIRLATTLTGELRHLGDRIDNLLVGSMGALVRDHEAGLFRIEQKLNER